MWMLQCYKCYKCPEPVHSWTLQGILAPFGQWRWELLKGHTVAAKPRTKPWCRKKLVVLMALATKAQEALESGIWLRTWKARRMKGGWEACMERQENEAHSRCWRAHGQPWGRSWIFNGIRALWSPPARQTCVGKVTSVSKDCCSSVVYTSHDTVVPMPCQDKHWPHTIP